MRDHRDLHEVAEVEHEEVVVDCSVGGVSQKHQKYQGHLSKSLSTKMILLESKEIIFMGDKEF